MIHKKLLCQSADYFDKAFNSTFKEGVDHVMYIPDDSPGAIGLFIHWLYKSNIAPGHSLSYVYDLYDLYILTNKLCLDELKNKTMDAIVEVAREYDLRDVLITPEIIKKLWDSLGDQLSTGLQFFTVSLMAWTFHERCDGINREENPRLMRHSDVVAIHGLDQELSKFVYRVHRRFQQLLQWTRRDAARMDPRIAALRTPPKPCLFHSHKKLDVCHLNSQEQEKPEFILDLSNSKNS